jgi:hypothetical protein
MPSNYDITLTRGTDYRLFFDYLDENNNPVDLTDASGKFTVKRYSASGFTLIEGTPTGVTVNFKLGTTSEYSYFTKNGGICFNAQETGAAGNTGGILVYLPKETTKYLAEGRHLYNFEFTVNDTIELISGKFVCEENESLGEITPIEQVPLAWKTLTAYGPEVYGLRNDSKIVYWSNISSGNDSTWRSGILEGVTGDYLTSGDRGIIGTISGGNVGLTFALDYEDDPLESYGLLPIPSGVSHIIQLELGDLHAIALSEDGQVFCWGDNTYGQCNIPNGISGAINIAAGQDISAVVLSDGTVIAWGATGDASAPYDGVLAANINNKGISSAIQIVMSNYDAYILKNDGTVVGVTGSVMPFGHNLASNFFYDFDSGEFQTTYGYTLGITLNNIVKLYGNGYYDYAAKNKSDEIYMWGYNNWSTISNCSSSFCAGTGYNNIRGLPRGITFQDVFITIAVNSGIDRYGEVKIWGNYFLDPYGVARIPPLE